MMAYYTINAAAFRFDLFVRAQLPHVNAIQVPRTRKSPLRSFHVDSLQVRADAADDETELQSERERRTHEILEPAPSVIMQHLPPGKPIRRLSDIADELLPMRFVSANVLMHECVDPFLEQNRRHLLLVEIPIRRREILA